MTAIATMRRTRLLLGATAVVLLTAAVLAAALWPARAAAASKAAPTLTLATPHEGVAGTLLLTAKLTGPDGKAVVNAPIDFVFGVHVLGQTEALLGTSTTTVSGTATWVYRVQQNGPVDFSARFAGNDALAPAVAPAVRYVVAGVAAATPSEASRVRLVGQWVPWAALALVAAVWLTLIGVAVRTIVAVPAAARGLAGPAEGDLAASGWQSVSDLETD